MFHCRENYQSYPSIKSQHISNDNSQHLELHSETSNGKTHSEKWNGKKYSENWNGKTHSANNDEMYFATNNLKDSSITGSCLRKFYNCPIKANDFLHLFNILIKLFE